MYKPAALAVCLGLAATVLARSSSDAKNDNTTRQFVPVDLPPPGDWIPTAALKDDTIRFYKANVSHYTDDTWQTFIAGKCTKDPTCTSYAIRQSWYYSARMWRAEIATGEPTTPADFVRAEPELDITNSRAWTWVPPPDSGAWGSGNGGKGGDVEKTVLAASHASLHRRAPSVPFVKVDLPAPGDWVASKELREGLITTFKTEPDHPTDAASWSDFVQDKCRARVACTSVHMYRGVDASSKDKNARIWFGDLYKGPQTGPSDYVRQPGISDSQAWSVLALDGSGHNAL